MAGLGSALETAKNTLLTQQILIQTASHNIANADNPAYARQTANVVTALPSRTTGGWVGNGTTIAQISQYRSAYIDRQLMTGVSQEADYRTRSSVLSPVASFLQDDGNSGLSASLGAFWDSWDTLSQNPAGTTEKQNVVTAAQNLAYGIQSTYDQLSSQGSDLKMQISDDIDQVNTLLQRIAGLNQQIASAETGGHTANDLRDSRFQAVTELSGYLGISYSEDASGVFTVSVDDGGTTYDLVSGYQYGGLGYYEDANGEPLIEYLALGGDPSIPSDWTSPAANSITGGSLSGSLSVWDTAFSPSNSSSYMSQLDTFAGNLITQVNSAYDSTLTDSVFSGTRASDISIHSSFTSTSVDPTNAITVSDLQNTAQPLLGDLTFGGYLAGIQHQVGVDMQNATSQADFQETLLSQLRSQQQSVSGVSIDEEMINLIKYQQIYQAAAKVVTATREMINTLVDMV